MIVGMGYVLCCGIALVILCLALIYVTSSKDPKVYRADEERYFLDENGERQLFPSLQDRGSIALSVIVPAYNEEDRLPDMLGMCLTFLRAWHIMHEMQSEVIIVSDGSTDSTVEVAHEFTREHSSEVVRVLKLVKNRGKGGAVRLGVQCARGCLILFADADGATRFSELEKFLLYLNPFTRGPFKSWIIVENIPFIVCGSRAHLEKEAMAKRSFFRNCLMHLFHSMVWLFAVRKVQDTQCGFKMFSREAARICFSSLHVEGWAFDVELLYIAEQTNIPIREIAVIWTEIDGSKIVPVLSWLQMGRDVMLIWLKYRIGAWRILKKLQ